MKTSATKLTLNESPLKLVKSTLKGRVTEKIYINTLMPNFSYTNHLGEFITPKKCALL